MLTPARRASEAMLTKNSKWLLAAAALAGALAISWVWSADSADSKRAAQGQVAEREVPQALGGGAGVTPGSAPAAATRPRAQPAEGVKMERLRSLADDDPWAALELSREIEREFPSGQMVDERSLLTMRALVHLGRIAAARDEATAFFEQHPESPWAERVERLTGVHPHGRGSFRR